MLVRPKRSHGESAGDTFFDERIHQIPVASVFDSFTWFQNKSSNHSVKFAVFSKRITCHKNQYLVWVTCEVLLLTACSLWTHQTTAYHQSFARRNHPDVSANPPLKHATSTSVHHVSCSLHKVTPTSCRRTCHVERAKHKTNHILRAWMRFATAGRHRLDCSVEAGHTTHP